MEWDKPSPTITTQFYGVGHGRFGHPEQDRAITPREAALIQGFPENYTFIDSRDQFAFNRLGRMIGNAVPVPFAKLIGESFVDHVAEKAQA
jgi:DNA (cytosine-5)-methyltransferase 1